MNGILLKKVYSDNVRINQIGGSTDGVSAEVMEDLGFNTPEQVLGMIAIMSDDNAISELLLESEE